MRNFGKRSQPRGGSAQPAVKTMTTLTIAKHGNHHPNGTDQPVRHLNQVDLSRRWKLSPRTLERWRWLRQGPRYVKVGGRVIYRLEDVETYEAERLYQPSEQPQAQFMKSEVACGATRTRTDRSSTEGERS